jgi:hypothetical protein
VAASRDNRDCKDREAWTQAQIADQRRRTEAEMNGLERHDRTTQIERYFWMAMATVGLCASLTRLAAGLLLLGGSGLRSWAVNRARSSRMKIGSPR